MTTEHPITPPPELRDRWIGDGSTSLGEGLIRASQWGADQELEACCEWLRSQHHSDTFPNRLRAARRPKPPSLKQQALEAMRGMQIEPCILDGVNTNAALQAKYDIIIRALEALPND
jgi:hypothetical protein